MSEGSNPTLDGLIRWLHGAADCVRREVPISQPDIFAQQLLSAETALTAYASGKGEEDSRRLDFLERKLQEILKTLPAQDLSPELLVAETLLSKLPLRVVLDAWIKGEKT